MIMSLFLALWLLEETLPVRKSFLIPLVISITFELYSFLTVCICGQGSALSQRAAGNPGRPGLKTWILLFYPNFFVTNFSQSSSSHSNIFFPFALGQPKHHATLRGTTPFWPCRYLYTRLIKFY